MDVTPKSIHPKDLEDLETYEIVWPFGGPDHGSKFTRIPQRSLRRIAQTANKWGYAARRELERRGTRYVDDPVELSFHSIDRLSQEALDMFVTRSNPEEGFKTFWVRIAGEAIAWGNVDQQGRYSHLGLKFIFDFRPKTPVLVTILDNRGADRKRKVFVG